MSNCRAFEIRVRSYEADKLCHSVKSAHPTPPKQNHSRQSAALRNSRASGHVLNTKVTYISEVSHRTVTEAARSWVFEHERSRIGLVLGGGGVLAKLSARTACCFDVRTCDEAVQAISFDAAASRRVVGVPDV